jgi:hypothetical protein
MDAPDTKSLPPNAYLPLAPSEVSSSPAAGR